MMPIVGVRGPRESHGPLSSAGPHPLRRAQARCSRLRASIQQDATHSESEMWVGETPHRTTKKEQGGFVLSLPTPPAYLLACMARSLSLSLPSLHFFLFSCFYFFRSHQLSVHLTSAMSYSDNYFNKVVCSVCVPHFQNRLVTARAECVPDREGGQWHVLASEHVVKEAESKGCLTVVPVPLSSSPSLILSVPCSPCNPWLLTGGFWWAAGGRRWSAT